MKKLIVIGITVLLLGLGLMIAGMNLLDWNFWDLDSDTYTKNEYTFEDELSGVSSIYADLEMGNIKIVAASELKIVYYEGEKDKVDITFENGTLKFLQAKENIRDYFVFFNGLKREKLVNEIHLPKDIILSVDIRTRNSRIEALDGGTFENLSLKTTNDRIRVKSVKTTDLTLESTNGRIEVQDANAEKIAIKTTNGAISIKEAESTSLTAETTNGKISIDTASVENAVRLKSTNSKIIVNKLIADFVKLSSTNGSLNIKDTDCREIDASTTNDPISANSVKASEKIKLVTTNDRITVTEIVSDDIYLYTSNDKVSGTIVGVKSDYNIESSTTNDKNNLGKNSADTSKKIYVRTTNGSINITFVAVK